ncbi:hypothetical protein H9Q69_009712 [Fusarium xylarioides]|nr:hypothetical protein H9Q69_009712 [Fusarium xylarioides]
MGDKPISSSRNGAARPSEVQKDISNFLKKNENIKGSKEDGLENRAREMVKRLVAFVRRNMVEEVRGTLESGGLVDDCFCWHMLMVALKGLGPDDATTTLIEILIERSPYLAFEHPKESDKVQKQYDIACKDRVNHLESRAKNIPEDETPFHVASEGGYARIVAHMLSYGRKLYDSLRQSNPTCKPSLRPKFSREKSTKEDYEFVEILQRQCRDKSPLTLAGDKRRFETVKVLLQEDGITWVLHDDNQKKPDPFVNTAIVTAQEEWVQNIVNKQTDQVTRESMTWAIENLKKPLTAIKGRPISETELEKRSRIFKILAAKAKSQTIDSIIIEKLIQYGRVRDYEAISSAAIKETSGGHPLHLAVKHQKLDFVEHFIRKDLGSVLREVPPGKATYPLGYLKTQVGQNSKDYTSIRDTIVSAMIRTDATMEKLSDIFSSSQVRDICFDMSHVNSANFRVSDIITSMIRLDLSHQQHLKYERILRYAAFPQLDLLVEDRQTYKSGCYLDKDHDEVFRVLRWLKEKKVDVIMKLKVPDRLINPHDAKEMASKIDEFEVIDLDWKVLDLSIANLEDGTKQRLEKLHLYSSGNQAVISHWFSAEGIASLRNVCGSQLDQRSAKLEALFSSRSTYL